MLEELEFDTIEAVREFNVKDRAFRNGWKEIYELTDQYFNDIFQENLDLSRQLNAEIKNDFACINGPDWQSRFDGSCNLVSQLSGISKLIKFICTPIYDETEIAFFTTEQEAYETGKRKAYDAMLDIWIRSCNEKIIEDEQKLQMSGVRNLLKRISSITGFEFNHTLEEIENENNCI